jgi:predicted ATPase
MNYLQLNHKTGLFYSKEKKFKTRCRFRSTFTSFVRCIATKEEPLVLFIDDLQWCDVGSLSLIQLMLMDPEIYLYFIGASRDVNANNARKDLIERTISELEAEGVRFCY